MAFRKGNKHGFKPMTDREHNVSDIIHPDKATMFVATNGKVYNNKIKTFVFCHNDRKVIDEWLKMSDVKSSDSDDTEL